MIVYPFKVCSRKTEEEVKQKGFFNQLEIFAI